MKNVTPSTEVQPAETVSTAPPPSPKAPSEPIPPVQNVVLYGMPVLETPLQLQEIGVVAGLFQQLYEKLTTYTPSRELSLTITGLQKAAMWLPYVNLTPLQPPEVS